MKKAQFVTTIAALMLGLNALAAACYDIVNTTADLIADPTPGASCGGLCNQHSDWAAGTSCAVPASSGPQNVVCKTGTVVLDQFGQAHCLNLGGLTTITTGQPLCITPCTNSDPGPGGES